jgi:hypothetical protein
MEVTDSVTEAVAAMSRLADADRAVFLAEAFAVNMGVVIAEDVGMEVPEAGSWVTARGSEPPSPARASSMEEQEPQVAPRALFIRTVPVPTKKPTNWRLVLGTIAVVGAAIGATSTIEGDTTPVAGCSAAQVEGHCP